MRKSLICKSFHQSWVIAFCIISVYFFTQCGSSKSDDTLTIDNRFGEYINAFTAGVISKNSVVSIKLTQDAKNAPEAGTEASGNLFSFSPQVKGKAFWIDARTIEFRPSEDLKSGTKYLVKFNIGSVADVPKELRTFEFSIQVITQNFDLVGTGLKTTDVKELKTMAFEGYISTADVSETSEIEKMLKASQQGRKLEIVWTHEPSELRHLFEIKGIQRDEKATSLLLESDGASIQVKRVDKEEIEIPAIGDFKLMRIEVVQTPDQYLSLLFSDPLDEKQNFNGMVQIGNVSNLRYQATGNELKVYLPSRQTGQIQAKIHAGIKNVLGYKFNKTEEREVLFQQMKPMIRLSGKGVILPSTDGMIFPFEAVNLNAVDVKIIKIYENNVAQFLQTNDLKGSNQMRRVGYPVINKRVSLANSGVTDFGRWNRFTLNLDDLIKAEPGAIYQIEMGFKMAYSTFHCEGVSANEVAQLQFADREKVEDWDTPDSYSYWDDDYYGGYDNEYEWSERDNPCHKTYYIQQARSNAIKRNILASDLGLIAKRGEDGKMMVIATDLKTTKPVSGVAIELLDYQQQINAKGSTDSDGMAFFQTERKPYLVIATYQQQKGYLKVDEASSLSLSNFEVSGAIIQKGIKGFIYGERDVWRPGDSLYLSFMLEDRHKILPANHPVIFELIDPRGQMEQRITKSSGLHGIYTFNTLTQEDAATGNWQAIVKVGGAEFSRTIKIETIKPNRLKINLDFGTESLSSARESITGNLEVKWLHGATAKNLRAVFDVVFSPVKTTFSKYTDYVFEDASKDFYTEKVEVFDERIDEQGKAVVRMKMPSDLSPPGKLNAYFSGRVFEESGDFSVDRFSIPYSPYNSYVGVRIPKGDSRGMLLTDTTHYADLVVVDHAGSSVSRSQLEVEIYKLDWRWWWDNSFENLSNYVGRSYHRPVHKSVVAANQGKGRVAFKIDYPEWGRYYIKVSDPASGHSTGTTFYMDWPGWAARGKKAFPDAATMLNVSTDKEKYNTGEQVNLSIPGSNAGRALVSVENGSSVINTWWVETAAGETPFSFKVTEDMAPNIFVHVHLLQPHAQTVNDLPIRLYGLLSLNIENPQSRLNPEVKTSESFEPGKEVKIEVKETNGKAMAYTVAVVDEGLLDLTRFKTPDPHAKFYAKEALGVRTWDVYDDVMGAFGGRLERMLAIGGDMQGVNPAGVKVNRFKPVVKFLGPYYLAAGKTATHSFTMPQYVGSVRTMVVAAYNGSYGHAEVATPVRQTLMVLASLPRVLGPGEKLSLPVNVFAMQKSLGNTKIQLKTSDLLQVVGNQSKQINFDQEGEEMVSFDLQVKRGTGNAWAEVEVSAGTHKANYRIDIEVRNPNPEITDVLEAMIEPGKTWEASFNALGIEGSNQASIELSNIPPINLEARLKYLLGYPHGCLEQTVSMAFPQLFIGDFVQLSTEKKMQVEENVKATIEKVRRFQHTDGGFTMWPGVVNINDWTTSYVGHFLVEARRKGYTVPESLMGSWRSFQERTANSWSSANSKNYGDLMQAYRLYTLALIGSPSQGAMNRLREGGKLSAQASWRLAATYVVIGQTDAANQLIAGASTAIPAYREMHNTYGSNIRDEAMILETLILLGQKEKGMPLLKKISASLSRSDEWMSTQTTAYALMAVAKFSGAYEKSNQLRADYSFNSSKFSAMNADHPMVSKELPDIKSKNNVAVKNNGTSPLFVRVVHSGQPVEGHLVAEVNQGVNLSVVFKSMAGAIIQPNEIKQGTDFMAEVTIQNPGIRGDLHEMVLNQVFPSGWEIHNMRMDKAFEARPNASKAIYQDIRDDRVYTYFDLPSGQKKTFAVFLNASYTGSYLLPATSCEAMYDATINARVPGQEVVVTKD